MTIAVVADGFVAALVGNDKFAPRNALLVS